MTMDIDTEQEVLRVATELFELVNLEKGQTEAQYRAAFDQATSEVLWRYPDFSRDLVFMALGRALGRREGAVMERLRNQATGLS